MSETTSASSIANRTFVYLIIILPIVLIIMMPIFAPGAIVYLEYNPNTSYFNALSLTGGRPFISFIVISALLCSIDNYIVLRRSGYKMPSWSMILSPIYLFIRGNAVGDKRIFGYLGALTVIMMLSVFAIEGFSHKRRVDCEVFIVKDEVQKITNERKLYATHVNLKNAETKGVEHLGNKTRYACSFEIEDHYSSIKKYIDAEIIVDEGSFFVDSTFKIGAARYR